MTRPAPVFALLILGSLSLLVLTGCGSEDWPADVIARVGSEPIHASELARAESGPAAPEPGGKRTPTGPARPTAPRLDEPTDAQRRALATLIEQATLDQWAATRPAPRRVAALQRAFDEDLERGYRVARTDGIEGTVLNLIALEDTARMQGFASYAQWRAWRRARVRTNAALEEFIGRVTPVQVEREWARRLPSIRPAPGARLMWVVSVTGRATAERITARARREGLARAARQYSPRRVDPPPARLVRARPEIAPFVDIAPGVIIGPIDAGNNQWTIAEGTGVRSPEPRLTAEFRRFIIEDLRDERLRALLARVKSEYPVTYRPGWEPRPAPAQPIPPRPRR